MGARVKKYVLAAFYAFGCAIGCTEGGVIPGVDAGPHDSGVDGGMVRIPDGSVRLDDVLIYAHSADTLYTFSPYTNTVETVGTFIIESPEDPWMLDLAVDGTGRIFTVGYEDIYIVDPDTLEASVVMTYRSDRDQEMDPLFALSFIPPSQSPTGREMFIGATNAGELYEIDLVTDQLVSRGRYPDNWGSSGDITSVDGLGTFATVRQRDTDGQPIDGEPDAVARITLSLTGDAQVQIIGTTETAGGQQFTALFGLGYWGSKLYGFTQDGELLEIDRDTGVCTIVSTTTGASEFFGAGVTTAVPFLI
jgi:hypothetical protein